MIKLNFHFIIKKIESKKVSAKVNRIPFLTASDIITLGQRGLNYESGFTFYT